MLRLPWRGPASHGPGSGLSWRHAPSVRHAHARAARSPRWTERTPRRVASVVSGRRRHEEMWRCSKHVAWAVAPMLLGGGGWTFGAHWVLAMQVSLRGSQAPVKSPLTHGTERKNALQAPSVRVGTGKATRSAVLQNSTTVRVSSLHSFGVRHVGLVDENETTCGGTKPQKPRQWSPQRMPNARSELELTHQHTATAERAWCTHCTHGNSMG